MPPFSRGFLLLQLRNQLINRRPRPFFIPCIRTIKLPPSPSPPRYRPKTPISSAKTIDSSAEDLTTITAVHPDLLSRLRFSTAFFFSTLSLRRILAVLGRVLRYIFLATPFILLITHTPPQLFWVQGGSMSPYFNTHYSLSTPATNTEDIVLVWRDRYDTGLQLPWPLSSVVPTRIANRRRSREDISKTQPRFQRGMIVVFRAPHDPSRITVKRIVGLPGDIVTPLPGSTFPPSSDSTSANPPTTVTIPWNHLWVEGDVSSRDASLDSNWYGPISQSLIIGRVTHVLQRPWMIPMRIDHGLTNTNTITSAPVSLYPAEQSKRVQHDAVRTVDPNANIWKEAYLYSGLGEYWLERLRADMKRSSSLPNNAEAKADGNTNTTAADASTAGMPRDLRSVKGQTLVAQIMRSTAEELARQDPESQELAGRLWDEAERWRRTLIEGFDDEKARLEIGNQTARKQKQSD